MVYLKPRRINCVIISITTISVLLHKEPVILQYYVIKLIRGIMSRKVNWARQV